jgi:hypothetical protein
LARNEQSLVNTICKVGKGRGENIESKKIQDSLSGDCREEGNVSTPKRSEGYSQTGGHKERDTVSWDQERKRESGDHSLPREDKERYVLRHGH